MTTKREVTISRLKFGEDTATIDQIKFWQGQGVAAIWDATFEIIDQWFLMKGIDPKTQKIDRSIIRKCKAPWLDPATEE